MNPHADTAGQEAHRAAREVLPWLLNGSLDGVELDSVRAHVQHCPACRDELDMLRALRDAVPACPDRAFDPEGALARMLPRLDATTAATPQRGAAPGLLQRWRASLAANESRWMRGAVLAQGALIAALLVTLAWPAGPGEGQYHLLGAHAHEQGEIIVVFRPETTERELRRIVHASGVRIVDGPTSTDAYLVSADGKAGAALARLRAESAVTLAEALGPEGRP